jgi:putative membrane protein (TIGR04086 family)
MKLHWGRIVAGGLLAEIALILAIVPAGLKLGDKFLHYTAGPGSFLFCFLGAWWVCRKVESRFVLHGILVGVVAALFYIGLTRFRPEPLAYIIAHVLKLAGGALGALVAQRRRGAAQSAAAATPSA